MADFPDDKINRLIAAAIADLQSYLESLESGDLTWARFKAAARNLLDNLYLSVATATASGALTPEQRAIVNAALEDQDNPEAKEWSLSQLFAEYALGAITIAMFAHRMTLYLKSARTAAWQVWSRDARGENVLFKRVLHGSNHCRQCVLYSALPPMRLVDMVLPGQACQCIGNCLCTLERVA